MKLVIIPNLPCGNACLAGLKRGQRGVIRGNGVLVKLKCEPQLIKKLAVDIGNEY